MEFRGIIRHALDRRYRAPGHARPGLPRGDGTAGQSAVAGSAGPWVSGGLAAGSRGPVVRPEQPALPGTDYQPRRLHALGGLALAGLGTLTAAFRGFWESAVTGLL